MICDLEYGHGLEVCSAHNQKVCRLSQSLKIKETHKQDTPVVEKSWPWILQVVSTKSQEDSHNTEKQLK
jgi:3-methyladenine DNA glycosylase AlkD